MTVAESESGFAIRVGGVMAKPGMRGDQSLLESSG
ncbi:hypothetical protein FHT85_004112 [Rhizobium sp. BK312]|nr:hypothetical protein [Rhizobium sp. BK312]